MKKVLLASTVLAMTATVAAAEVTLSGDARMGILNGFQFGAGVANPDDTGFTSRARVTFTMSGETDGGLAFGASFRADNAGGAAGGTAGSVFISGAFGKLSMGDVDGAAQSAVGHVDGVGLTGLGDTNEMTYLAAGGLTVNGLGIPGLAGIAPAVTGDPTALYEYSAGALAFYASVTNPGYNFAVGASQFDGIAYALGAAYTLDAYKFSIGYEKLDVSRFSPAAPAVSIEADHWILGADATFGAVTVKARYGEANVDLNNAGIGDFKQSSLSATYKQDALGVTAFISNKSMKNPVGGANLLKVESYGLGGSYDLGGGATLKGGVANQKRTVGVAAPVKDTSFDFGVAFTF